MTELRNQWFTPSEIAIHYKRSQQRVCQWCTDGTLEAFKFRILRTRNGWWIAYPENYHLQSPLR